VARLLQEGRSVREVARTFNVHPATIYRCIEMPVLRSRPRAALEAAPVIADLSSWLADVAGKAGIAWERLFDAPEEKSLLVRRHQVSSRGTDR
jgi:hypothetical protein